MRLPARLAIMVLAAFTVLDVAILLSIGHSRHAPQLLDRIVAKTSTASPGTDTAPTAMSGHQAAAPPATARATGYEAAPQSNREVQRTETTAAQDAATQPAKVTAKPQPRQASRPGKATADKGRPAKAEAGRPAATKAAPRKAAPKNVAPRKPKKVAPRKAVARSRDRLHVSRSHYIRSITGGKGDAPAMFRLGRFDAAANVPNRSHVVLLDIGGQSVNGVRLSATTKRLSYAGLTHAMSAYIAGYHSHQAANAPVTIAIGTNNDIVTNAATGRLWAQLVVDPVSRAARKYAGITIAGAVDFEPGFAAGPKSARAWIGAYLRYTRAPLIFNGSADGCSWTRTHSACANGWTARDLAYLAGGASERIKVLPQIYNRDMAGQWAQIALTGVRDRMRRLQFLGALTENAACLGQANCPTMAASPARLALWGSLHHYPQVASPGLPIATDLDVR